MERQIRGVHEGTERIDERFGRLERDVSQGVQDVENAVKQLRKLIMMRAASSSGELGGQ